MRGVRGRGQKEIKSDVDSKVVGKEEGRSDSKSLDSSTKKRTDEIDAIFERAKKVYVRCLSSLSRQADDRSCAAQTDGRMI